MAKRKDKSPAAPATLAPELMARVRQIQIRTHDLVSELLQGAYRSTFRGTGIEFEEVRPYQPGDEVRTIDWNVTARAGEPYVKTYVEERQLVLQLLVDTSLSMDFGSAAKTKREAAAEVAALLSFVAVQEQDMVGLTLFDDQPGLHLRPEKGSRHVLRVVREVMAAEARGRGSSLTAVLEHQLRHLRRRSLIFVVSDFHDVDPGWTRVLGRVARRHDVVCVRVFDPFEEELPNAGWITLHEPETGRRVEVDSRSAAVRRSWAAAAEERRQSFREATARARAARIDVDASADSADPVVAFFKRRARARGRR
ncbi:MAG: DUF58 domain-containing protein [Planctomycetota bacterium]